MAGREKYSMIAGNLMDLLEIMNVISDCIFFPNHVQCVSEGNDCNLFFLRL